MGYVLLFMAAVTAAWAGNLYYDSLKRKALERRK